MILVVAMGCGCVACDHWCVCGFLLVCVAMIFERETKDKEKEMKNKKRIFKWIAKRYRTIDVGSVIKWGVKINKASF